MRECRICGDEAVEVDHNHITGMARGWLCRQCNRGLGNFKESPELMIKAMRYLAEPPGIPECTTYREWQQLKTKAARAAGRTPKSTPYVQKWRAENPERAREMRRKNDRDRRARIKLAQQEN